MSIITVVNIYLTPYSWHSAAPMLLYLVLMVTMQYRYCPIFQLRLLRLRKHEGFAFAYLVSSDRIITSPQIFWFYTCVLSVKPYHFVIAYFLLDLMSQRYCFSNIFILEIKMHLFQKVRIIRHINIMSRECKLESYFICMNSVNLKTQLWIHMNL